MDKDKCTVCEYEYDPENGEPNNVQPPRTSFENLLNR